MNFYLLKKFIFQKTLLQPNRVRQNTTTGGLIAFLFCITESVDNIVVVNFGFQQLLIIIIIIKIV